MDINFNTDRLIIINYPRYTGGKFISMALGLHPNILIQEQTMARLQMREGANPMIGFNLAMETFKKTKEKSKNFEWGCMELANFNVKSLQADARADETRCNDLWRELTNQNKFYFFMADHTDLNMYSKYVNRKTIRLTNYEWILKKRNKIAVKLEHDIDGDSIAFDMESMKEKSSFIDEIYKIFNFLGLARSEAINRPRIAIQLETLRTSFLDLKLLPQFFSPEEK